MATVIDSLLVRLGFDADTSGAASFETGIGRVVKTAGKAAAVISGVGIAAAGFLGKSLLDTASQFEQFKTQLTTIEGSSEKAQKSLDWIADFAKKTPYELAEVTDAFVKMKSYGLDPIDGNFMESIGNMASGMGKSIDQAVEAVADAVTGENERLKEFGIKSSKDKKTNTITYTYSSNGETFTKTVENDAKAISKGLQEIMDERFSGGMDAMSKTWSGTISNLQDTWQAFLMQIANAGIFDIMKDGLVSVAEWVQNNEDKITAFALAIAEGFKIAIATIGAIVDALVLFYGQISDFLAWIDENSQSIVNTIKVIGGIAAVIAGALVLMYAPAIAGFLLMQATGILSFLLLQGAAIASAAATAAAWLVAFAPFLLIGAVIAVVIGLLWLVYTNWQQIVAGLVAEWERIKAAFNAGISSISAWWSGLMASISGAFSAVVGFISSAWAGLWGGVKAIAGSAIDWVIGKIQALTGLISGALSSITSIGNFKMPSFSAPKMFGGSGKGGSGNTSSVNQTFNVSSASAASSIARNSVGAQRRSNTGVKQ